MKDGFKLDSSIVLDSYTTDFLTPNHLFYKIEKDYKLKVSDNAYVYIGDVLMVNKKGQAIKSNVSGRVLGVKDMLYYQNKVYPSLVVENDFRENTRLPKYSNKYINKYGYEEIIEILEDVNIVYKGKKIVDKIKNCISKTVIVNGIDIEPYVGNKYFLQKKRAEDILEICDLLLDKCELSGIHIALNNMNGNLISEYVNRRGTYPSVKLEIINGAFPNGIPELIEKKLGISDAVFFEIEEILYICDAFKNGVAPQEKYITITGSAVKPNRVIKVKLGSLLSEAFINNFDFTEPFVKVYLNGIMGGKIINVLKYVVDTNIDAIIINKKEESPETSCINCGLCSKYCPKKLNPKYAMDHDGKINIKYKKGCLQCGICNFVCPSKIDLKKNMECECE